jgi:hypothetical protein
MVPGDNRSRHSDPQRLTKHKDTKHKESALRQAEKGLSHLTAARSEGPI